MVWWIFLGFSAEVEGGFYYKHSPIHTDTMHRNTNGSTGKGNASNDDDDGYDDDGGGGKLKSDIQNDRLSAMHY